jgi:hypothetical protein
MKIMKKISRERANELAKIKDFRMRKAFTVDELREDGEAFFQNDPPDLISEKSWKYIMNFPDNVAVITSNRCGSSLDQMVEFMMFWQTQSNSSSPKYSLLSLAIYTVNEYFGAFAFNILHGFYKQAVVCLRYSVEAMMQALCLETLKTQENSDLKNIEEKWLFGMLEKKEQEKLKFGNIRSILEKQDCFKSIKPIFSHGGMVESLYNSFSKYSHYKHQHESNENHHVIHLFMAALFFIKIISIFV